MMSAPAQPESAAVEADEKVANDELVPCTIRELAVYFLRVGSVGFGGPIALAGYMQKDLVEERRWISKDDYKEGLALAQLAPGFIGFLVAGLAGASVAALATFGPCYLFTILPAPYFRKSPAQRLCSVAAPSRCSDGSDRGHRARAAHEVQEAPGASLDRRRGRRWHPAEGRPRMSRR